MDNLYIETYFFSVPYRLIWNNWEKFNGAQDNPGDSTDYLCPQTTGTVTTNSLFDYFGVPVNVNLSFNNFAGRAYNLIYNQWFRDENLQDSIIVDKDDGPDTITDYVIKRKGKQKDYFTSALPWPQKGEAVTLPLGGLAPVSGIGKLTDVYTGPFTVHETGNTTTSGFAGGSSITGGPSDTTYYVEEDPNNSGFPGIFADLSEATAATINQLREAFQIQKLYERDARGGTRYIETILSHFGVSSPDARLQRAEYLGGKKDRINVNPIPQTSSTDATTPQANMSGYATTGFTGHTFNKSFTEHCVVLGMACVYADLTYNQGLPRHFSRQIRWDFYWPALAHLGEQAILNKEIFAQGITADDTAWGYQERFAEYRYKPSFLTGQMRTTATDPSTGVTNSLDTWHLAQDFASLPSLNDTFIEQNPPVSRVIAVQTEPEMLLDLWFKLRCTRPMPTFSVPGLVDHF
jgi:hypothetical protein